MLGEEHAAADLADLVAGAADALEGAGDARRRLDLDDEVDRAHVDAELEAAGRDHAGQPAALEVVLDQRPLLLGDRAVVGLRDDRVGADGRARLRHHLGRRRAVGRRRSSPGALGGDLVEPGGQPLGEAARVGEDDRRAVLLDQVDHVLLDVRPDRGRPRGRRRAASSESSYGAGAVMSSTGTTTLRSHSLADGGATISTGVVAAEEARHLLERPDRRGQTDPLGRLGRAGRRGARGSAARWAPRLVAGHGVHLVDDHRLDVRADSRGPGS